jgi:hypothetical protein
MKGLAVFISAGLLALLPHIAAHPGFRKHIAEIQARAAAPISGPEDSNELLGDLISPGPTTDVGKVGDCLVLGCE